MTSVSVSLRNRPPHSFIVYSSFLSRPSGAAVGYFYLIARGLLAPGLLGYFCHAAKVPKNALKERSSLRILLHYGRV